VSELRSESPSLRVNDVTVRRYQSRLPAEFPRLEYGFENVPSQARNRVYRSVRQLKSKDGKLSSELGYRQFSKEMVR
jgi:hypothetical protein